MANYFTHLDTFIDAQIGEDGTLYVQKPLNSAYGLDDTDYWDRQMYARIKKLWVVVTGASINYWITGNVLDNWVGETRIERAKNFAIWYHKNKHRFTKVDLNSP